ncbi:MAG: hypothetical protein P8J59_06520 [Phycisphaerales bacterium]|jgi:hypothetical protein|nr:hypothetical protein [Phycisphaerales bacterium]
MAFVIPLTIERIPELQSLSAHTRKIALSKARTPGPIRLWFFNVVGGVGGTLVFLLVGHNLGLNTLPPTPAIILTFGVLLFFTLLSHIWTITRIRDQIRFGIREASQGRPMPICIECGYDCAGIVSDECPECGSPRNVPSNEPRS